MILLNSGQSASSLSQYAALGKLDIAVKKQPPEALFLAAAAIKQIRTYFLELFLNFF
jgi:hypothetical protein